MCRSAGAAPEGGLTWLGAAAALGPASRAAGPVMAERVGIC